jgi:hypothetical protein
MPVWWQLGLAAAFGTLVGVVLDELLARQHPDSQWRRRRRPSAIGRGVRCDCNQCARGSSLWQVTEDWKKECATIPIPRGWKQFDPSTPEGRRQISHHIVNVDDGKAADYLYTIAAAATASTASNDICQPSVQYTRNQFDQDIQYPLTSTDATDATVPPCPGLWTAIIPAVWRALPDPPRRLSESATCAVN